MPLRLIPPISPTGILQWFWIDPGGTTHDLTPDTSPNLCVDEGATGLGDVDVQVALEKIPFGSGSLARHGSIPERRIELPIFVDEESFGDLVLAADALRTWFATADERRLTPGTLRVIRPDDSVRQIDCYRTGGLAGDWNEGAAGWTTYTVALLAPDPFPTGPEDVVHTYVQADFGDEIIVINDGELDAYPIWTAMGPWAGGVAGTEAFKVENLTTGEAFSFYFALTADIGVIVDTRPASMRTKIAIRRYPDDLSLLEFSNANPELWWLAPGENRFTITIPSGTTADTSVELRYRERYRGLLK